MATESVVNPVMMNRPIVDPKTGSLTQYGYALLSGLQIRTGGTVSQTVNVPDLEGQIAQASFYPVEQPRQADMQFSDVIQAPTFDATSFPEPMQIDLGPDPFAVDVTWQRI